MLMWVVMDIMEVVTGNLHTNILVVVLLQLKHCIDEMKEISHFKQFTLFFFDAFQNFAFKISLV